jgi:hypothetical protein
VSTYSSTEVVTIIAAITGLLTTLSVAIVNIVVVLRTGRKVDDNTALTHAIGIKTDAVKTQADVIERQTNGAASAAAAMIADLQRQVIALHASMADHKQTAALLAAAVAAQGQRSARRAGDDDPIKVDVINNPLITKAESV